ncbi:hypothetical protein [Roseibium sediminicola]|uniref:DUF4157 domain-containing protein n=1 Tax=Roseibium sediminicola TaxID=2933272 RepID=A0ABT0GMK7_9HYPH|nr:hypothetical protein [Roseibium sp. CAU 1639]MCK7610656.1 hypothetical protein [Roseibium sp. CAU 1639]
MQFKFLLGVLCLALALSGCRALTANEKNFASKIYSGQLNANKIEVYSPGKSSQDTNDKLKSTLAEDYASAKSVESYGLTKSELLERAAVSLRSKPEALVIHNRIYYKTGSYKADFAEGFPTRVNVDDLDLLAHEIMHVWQYQNRERTGFSLLAIAMENIRYRDPYAYTIVPGKRFLSYRFEQQGKMAQDYVRLSYIQPNSAKLKKLRKLLSEEFDLKIFNETLMSQAG